MSQIATVLIHLFWAPGANVDQACQSCRAAPLFLRRALQQRHRVRRGLRGVGEVRRPSRAGKWTKTCLCLFSNEKSSVAGKNPVVVVCTFLVTHCKCHHLRPKLLLSRHRGSCVAGLAWNSLSDRKRDHSGRKENRRRCFTRTVRSEANLSFRDRQWHRKLALEAD